MLRFTPSSFLDLLERERCWCELLLTPMCIRAKLRTPDTKSIVDDLISQALNRRTRALRN